MAVPSAVRGGSGGSLTSEEEPGFERALEREAHHTRRWRARCASGSSRSMCLWKLEVDTLACGWAVSILELKAMKS